MLSAVVYIPHLRKVFFCFHLFFRKYGKKKFFISFLPQGLFCFFKKNNPLSLICRAILVGNYAVRRFKPRVYGVDCQRKGYSLSGGSSIRYLLIGFTHIIAENLGFV